MEKKQSGKPQRRQLETSELQGVVGGVRIWRPGDPRIPVGYTDTGEPIYGEDDGGGSDEDGL